MGRLVDLVVFLALIVAGLLYFGWIGAFCGAVLGLLLSILGEVQRGNDRTNLVETDPLNAMFEWLDRKTGGRFSDRD